MSDSIIYLLKIKGSSSGSVGSGVRGRVRAKSSVSINEISHHKLPDETQSERVRFGRYALVEPVDAVPAAPTAALPTAAGGGC